MANQTESFEKWWDARGRMGDLEKVGTPYTLYYRRMLGADSWTLVWDDAPPPMYKLVENEVRRKM